MSLSSYLGYQRLVLDLIIREATAKLLQEGRQLVRVYAGGSEDLESASFNAHNEVSFVGGALSHHLVSCQQGIDVLSRPSGERQHLCHALKACFFFEVCKPQLQRT